MNLEQAIKHADDLIEWYIEGMAPESEARLREDIECLEILKKVGEEKLHADTAEQKAKESSSK